MRKSTVLIALLVVIAALVAGGHASAASFGADFKEQQTLSGKSRVVTYSGSIVLGPGESVADVRIVYTISGTTGLGQAQGLYNASTGKFSASVGDFALTGSFLQATIRTKNGTQILKSATYPWLGK